MAGRKEKPVAHQPLNTDPNNGGPSKFRRKLSHSLSFISNPLSQRKTTPGRLPPLDRQSLAPGGSAVAVNINSITVPRDSDRLLSPVRDSRSDDDSCGSHVPRRAPKDGVVTNGNDDPNATPRPPPLPRSRTMSFIPRPTRSMSDSSEVELESTPKPQSPPFTSSLQARTSPPSKIPSPPSSKRRRSSPRQYTPQHTTQQEKHIAAGMAFAGAAAQSLSKASVRSYTTPNLVKGNVSPQSGSLMIPRKSALQHKHFGSPSRQRQSMKENTPTGKRDSCRISQIQAPSKRRESLAVPSVVSTRRSFGPNRSPKHSPRQSKQAIRTTPPTAKRLSTNLSAHTPLTARRLHPNTQSSTLYRYSNGSSIPQTRLMGLVNPPTPQAIDPAAAQPALPRGSTERNLRRRTFTRTPSGDHGAGALTRSVAGSNSEVRLPRSTTCPNFWRRSDTPPPVPPIPEKYKSMSQPLLVPPDSREPDVVDHRHRLSLIPEQESGETQTEKADSEADIPTGISSPFIMDPKKTDIPDVDIPFNVATFNVAMSQPSDSGRAWSIHDQHVDSADIENLEQVRDYMPPLWWAGRLQSRLDQWRGEAMKAALDPTYKPQGMIGKCSLDEDKAAACYIFLQLRDLCVSNQAADSLWDFEYKYRQDNKLLGNSVNVPTYPKHKLDDTSSRQGPIGRAVRKLTPRKSSLVNLLKGKGWNKAEQGITEQASTSSGSTS